ncbi:MAG: M1 family aminopeptidase [Bacteroidales bacterium]
MSNLYPGNRPQITKTIFFTILLILPACLAMSLSYSQGMKEIDVLQYNIDIEINDTTNEIKGNAAIEVLITDTETSVTLDLASINNENKGMVVDSIFMNGTKTDFVHEDNLLRLPVPEIDSTTITNINVFYHGIPADGLIISPNKHGQRTFFASNWPDQAHHWFPCNDHPADRATVNFTITAPSHYQVIATGLLSKKINMPGKKTSHYWSSSVQIPTKSMTFAAAEFAVFYPGYIDSIPYSNWVYPQSMEEGFNDFSVTPDILRFFSDMLGQYPFEKVANVQSTANQRGTENAGTIYYDEKSVTGDHTIKYTIVQELANQWFGSSVTESDWPHLWLSKGIATWLTGWYIEQNNGGEELIDRLILQREKIIDFTNEKLVPVVDHHPADYTELLNPNIYQKGSWILHMLRRDIGEKKLIETLVEFYEQFELSSASTNDFMKILENVSGQEMEQFFDDWLYSAGHPVLDVSTSFKNGRLNMELLQTQQHKMAFTFPLDIRFVFEDGKMQDHTFDIIFRRHEFIIDMPSEPVEIILDPDVWLLFEQKK